MVMPARPPITIALTPANTKNFKSEFFQRETLIKPQTRKMQLMYIKSRNKMQYLAMAHGAE